MSYIRYRIRQKSSGVRQSADYPNSTSGSRTRGALRRIRRGGLRLQPMSDQPIVERNADAERGVGSAAFSPLYQQIKSLLLQGLDRGEWKPGEAIPSEHELAARFQVSQGTVRKAIDELAAENLLLRRQGKGTFVATHHEAKVRFRF